IVPVGIAPRPLRAGRSGGEQQQEQRRSDVRLQGAERVDVYHFLKCQLRAGNIDAVRNSSTLVSSALLSDSIRKRLAGSLASASRHCAIASSMTFKFRSITLIVIGSNCARRWATIVRSRAISPV